MQDVLELKRSADDWSEPLARGGLVAKGVSYGLVGALAVGVAVGVGGQTTSREGALHQLAGGGFGKMVLVLLAFGLAGYAAWRLVQAWTVDKDGAAKTWGVRAGYVGRALIYGVLAFNAAKLVAGSGGGEQSQTQKAHRATGEVLSWPGGRWLVGIAGLVLIGVAAWNLFRGVTRKFEDKWVDRSDAAQTWGGIAGIAGHVARAVVFTLIGLFAIEAARDYNPKDAVGLDGALQKLAQQPYGPLLLGVTAAGLLAYGLYCFVDARYRDTSA